MAQGRGICLAFSHGLYPRGGTDLMRPQRDCEWYPPAPAATGCYQQGVNEKS